MNIVVLSRDEEKKWDDFVRKHPLGSVHQLSSWAHFQSTLFARDEYLIVALMRNDKIIGGSLVIKHRLPKGFSWLYAPRGPLFDYSDLKINHYLKLFTDGLRDFAKKNKSIFLRIDPAIERYPIELSGFFRSKNGYQPQHTLFIDLKMSESDILAQMKQKGRYNIKLASKKGVVVHETDVNDSDEYVADLNSFFELLNETTNRDGFSGHGKSFYKSMLDFLSVDGYAKLFIASYEGVPVAGLIATFSNGVATYYYGASGNKYRNIMAPYLLQWEVIKYAKANGFETYDFLGVAPKGVKNHVWSGVTSFKRKFGGRYFEYAPVLEKPFSVFLYILYRFYKFMKKL